MFLLNCNVFKSGNNIVVKSYSSFGMPMPGRTLNNDSYRYGFNGKENDNEVKGNGNQQDYGLRIYDPRLGRFLSVDPLSKDYPHYTPYSFAGNKPISCIDLDGAEEFAKVQYSYNGTVFFSRTQPLPAVNRASDVAGNRINSGVAVVTINITSMAQFANIPNPKNFVAGMDFTTTNIDPNSLCHLSSIEQRNLNLNKNNEVKTFPPSPININFAPNSATMGEVQTAYNNNQDVKNAIDIAVGLLNAFPKSTLEITGNTDAAATNYVSNNQNNPNFNQQTTDGNVPLSYDRADITRQFIINLAQAASGNVNANRVTAAGAGSSNASQPANASAAQRRSDRVITTKFTQR